MVDINSLSNLPFDQSNKLMHVFKYRRIGWEIIINNVKLQMEIQNYWRCSIELNSEVQLQTWVGPMDSISSSLTPDLSIMSSITSFSRRTSYLLVGFLKGNDIRDLYLWQYDSIICLHISRAGYMYSHWGEDSHMCVVILQLSGVFTKI